MRSRALVSLVVVSGLALAPRLAAAQDISNDLGLAKALVDHGIYEPAEALAQQLIEAGRNEAMVIKALAIAGRAKQTSDSKALAEAKKVLNEAVVKGVKGAKEVEPLLANPPAPKFGAGKFELDFAWRLKNRGLIGAAEAAIEGAIKGANLQPNELRNAQMIRAILFGDRSRIPELTPADDPAPEKKRKEAFEKAKESLLGVATGAGATPDDVVEAKGTLYDLYYTRGNGLFEASKRIGGEDLSKGEALKKEALEAFKAGVAFLEEECKKLEEELAKGAQPEQGGEGGDQGGGGRKPLPERCLIFANYYWPKCLVGQAKCAPSKDEHDSLIKKALDIYQTYNLNYGGEFQGKEAAIDMAEAYREIGDEETAIIALESALSIEKDSPDYDPLHPPDARKGLRIGFTDQSGKFIADPTSLDVFARASLVKGKSLKQKRDYKKALLAFDKVFAHAKATGIDYDKEPLGKQIRIERAEALARDGKQKEAQADLKKMIDEDPTGPTGQLARAMVAKIAGGGGGATSEIELGLTAARASALADESFEKGDFNTAQTYARLTFKLAKKEGVESKFSPKALLVLGRAYLEYGRYYEASIAFEEVTRRYKDVREVASQAALEQVRVFQILKSKNANSWDKDQYEKALTFLTQNYPNEGKGIAPFLLALQHQEEKEWADAAKAYGQVPPEAGDIYDKALFFGAQCRYLVARGKLGEKKEADAKTIFAETEAGLRKAIDLYAKEDGITDDRKKKRKDLDADARFLLADVLLQPTINKPKDVLSLLEKAEQIFEGTAAASDRLSRAGLMRILAHLKLGAPDAAEAQLKVLFEKYKSERRTILAAREVAVALDNESAKKKDMTPEERRKLRERLAQYYAHWVLVGLQAPETTPSVKEMRQVAIRLFTMGLDVAGLPEDGGFLQELADGFDPGPAKQIFADAAAVYGALAKSESIKQLPDAWNIYANWGEAAGFSKDWAACRQGLEAAVEATKLIGANGQIDINIVSKNKVLLAYYYDLGLCFRELGAEQPECYDKAFGVFNNVVNAAAERSRTWWKVKLDYYRTLDRRGKQDDYKELAGALRALERKYPKFTEADKFGLASKFADLVKSCEAKGQKVLGN